MTAQTSKQKFDVGIIRISSFQIHRARQLQRNNSNGFDEDDAIKKSGNESPQSWHDKDSYDSNNVEEEGKNERFEDEVVM